MHKKSSSYDNVIFPLLKEQNISQNIKLRVIPWHQNFDALIGSKDMRKLKANIDYEKQLLTIGDTQIPFYFEYNQKQINLLVTHKDEIIIPTTLDKGTVLIPSLKLNDYEIPECIAEINKGLIKIPNIYETPFQSKFEQRINVVPIEYFNIEVPNEKLSIPISEMIRTNTLNSEERNALLNLCSQYKNIFYHENTDLSFTNQIKHHIRTKDEVPIFTKSFRHPPSMREEIESQIQKLLNNKIIRPSISPYSSPVWIVPKKLDASGKKKYRMVIDYRKLNDNTIEDKYPLPKIEEILDNLGRCTYFTTLDLAQGFHQIEMDPQSIEKTAFTVNNGHYEYLRMPFGLKNAPATFQKLMDHILRSHLYKICFVYMDDVVIFSRSLQEHIHHIKIIFEELRKANLKIQLDKSEFLCKQVAFLGHIITPEGIKPNPSKVEAVQKFPIPKTVKEIKRFLGLIGYYRKFIANFAKLTSPLSKCLRKGEKINIENPDYIEAFNICKELLQNAPVLIYPDFNKTFTLTTDASNVSIGSVLSQNNRPIAYYSRTLNSAERNYSTIEKEMLSIHDSCRHYRPYVYGRRFIIETDHNPLVWLSKIKEPNSRLVRWKLKLEEYNFEIKYRKGKENYVADALSRIEININETDDASMVPNIAELPVLDDLDAILELDNSEPEIENISNELETAHTVSNNDQRLVIPISEQPVNYSNHRIICFPHSRIQTKHKKIFNKDHYVIKFSEKSNEMHVFNEFKNAIIPSKPCCLYIQDKELRDITIRLLEKYLNNSAKISISNTYLYDLPDNEAKLQINLYHLRNHNGINETYNHLKQKYYNPKLKTFIIETINNCEKCLSAKYDRNPYQLQLEGPLLATKPFETLHLDIFTYKGSKFITIIDLFSRYGQAYHIKQTDHITVLNKLRHYFSHHAFPKRIVMDNATNFLNDVVKEYMKMHNIEFHYTTPYNPNSNSPIERMHSTLIEKLRILNIKNPSETPANQMLSAVLIYNQSIHTATGFPPFSILYGPYLIETSFNQDMTIYENYNQKRKDEILPFYDELYNKQKQQAEKRLEKHNENKEPPIKEIPDTIAVKNNKRGKHEPLYSIGKDSKLVSQNINKITSKIKKKYVNIHGRRMKRVRHSNLLQNPSTESEDTPCTSNHTPSN